MKFSEVKKDDCKLYTLRCIRCKQKIKLEERHGAVFTYCFEHNNLAVICKRCAAKGETTELN